MLCTMYIQAPTMIQAVGPIANGDQRCQRWPTLAVSGTYTTVGICTSLFANAEVQLVHINQRPTVRITAPMRRLI